MDNNQGYIQVESRICKAFMIKTHKLNSKIIFVAFYVIYNLMETLSALLCFYKEDPFNYRQNGVRVTRGKIQLDFDIMSRRNCLLSFHPMCDASCNNGAGVL